MVAERSVRLNPQSRERFNQELFSRDLTAAQIAKGELTSGNQRNP
jgi:hypothetical protein